MCEGKLYIAQIVIYNIFFFFLFAKEPRHLHVPYQQRAGDRCHFNRRPSSVSVGLCMAAFFFFFKPPFSRPPQMYLFHFLTIS